MSHEFMHARSQDALRQENTDLRARIAELEEAARRQHGSAAQAVGGDIAAGHFKPHPATREWQEVPRHTPGAVILYHAAGWPHAAAEQPAAAGNALTEALERVAAYIERRKKSRGLDIEHVHGFDLGPNEGVELLLSDIETIAAHTRASDGEDAERLEQMLREEYASYCEAVGRHGVKPYTFNEYRAKAIEKIDAAMQQAASNSAEGAQGRRSEA